ncbi:MAG TPA: hypothetical protein VGF67_02645 [Ktedonobacteraceae bacterium]|jgi:hypothetical protein
MPSSRIFVSYVCLGDEPGTRIGKQLLSDIRATNTEAVSDHETISDEHFMPFLMRELPQCGCLIVVQTPVALQSWRVQNAVAMANVLTTQQQMQMIRVIALPSPSANEQPLWAALPAFDASVDYPRVREKILLALHLTRFDAGDSSIIEYPLAPGPDLPEPARRYLSPQPSGSMFGAGGSDWSAPPFARPSQLAGTPRPVQQPGSAASGGTNWPQQPSSPMATPGGTSRFAAQGSPRTPIDPSGSPVLPRQHSSGSVLSRIWSMISRLSRTGMAALPLRGTHETITLRSDHPRPLDSARQSVIRWTVVIGIFLILILAAVLIVVLAHNHVSG